MLIPRAQCHLQKFCKSSQKIYLAHLQSINEVAMTKLVPNDITELTGFEVSIQ